MDATRPSVAHRAPPFVVFRGQRYIRRSGFLAPEHDPTCLLGHPVRQRRVYPLEDGSLPCPHRDGQSAECGAQIYILVFPSRGEARRHWVADVDRADMGLFEIEGFSVEQILGYFHASFPTGPARVVPSTVAVR